MLIKVKVLANLRHYTGAEELDIKSEPDMTGIDLLKKLRIPSAEVLQIVADGESKKIDEKLGQIKTIEIFPILSSG